MTIAVIGLGGAGGNIANEASLLGLPTGAINFSQKDLDSLENVRHKLKIMGSEGVGHDRDLAISLVQEHCEMVVNFVKDHFSNPSINVLAFPFASSGGSGSGIAPILIHLLSSVLSDKVIIAIPIIPDESESTISQVNCSATFEELSRLNVAIFPIDNQSVKAKNPMIGKGKLYEATNTYIVEKLAKIASYTEKHSINGNFDRTDFVTLLRQRGMAIISEVDIVQLPKADLNPEAIAATIQESWSDSIFAPIEYEHVLKAGIIFDGQEELLPFIEPKLIFDCFRNKMPIDLFEGNYHEQNGQIITILTGLPWCKRRFDIVDRLIEEGEQKVEFALNLQENVEYTSKSKGFASKFKQKTTPVSQETKSMSDLIKTFRR
jgi:cell division GTPase FtsZ